MVREILRTWLAREESLPEAVFDFVRTRSDLRVSGLKFVGQSVGGYIFVSVLIRSLNTVVTLWQTSRHPYALVLLALQISITLYAVVEVGKIAEQLSEIHGKMDTKRRPMIIEIRSDLAKRRDPEGEGSE